MKTTCGCPSYHPGHRSRGLGRVSAASSSVSMGMAVQWPSLVSTPLAVNLEDLVVISSHIRQLRAVWGSIDRTSEVGSLTQNMLSLPPPPPPRARIIQYVWLRI